LLLINCFDHFDISRSANSDPRKEIQIATATKSEAALRHPHFGSKQPSLSRTDFIVSVANMAPPISAVLAFEPVLGLGGSPSTGRARAMEISPVNRRAKVSKNGPHASDHRDGYPSRAG